MIFGRRQRQPAAGNRGDARPSRTHLVTKDFPTIQRALEAASAGDTIIVQAGIYRENLDFAGKEVTLRSQDPRDRRIVSATIIDGTHSGSVVLFRSGEQRGAVLAGFTITNGYGRLDGCGGGVTVLNHSSPIIEHNIIEGNRCDLDGGGILVDRSHPLIRNNLVRNNRAGGGGGGIHVGRDFTRSEAEEEPDPSDRLDAFTQMLDSNATVQEIRMKSHMDSADFPPYLSYASTGVDAPEAVPRAHLQNNTFLDNSAVYGGGLHISDDGPQVEANAFRGNRARAGGAIMLWAGAHPLLSKNQITRNHASAEGGGIMAEWGSSPLLVGNVITQNTSPLGAAMVVAANSTPVIRGNRIGQDQGQHGEAVFCWPNSAPVWEDHVTE
ncbi:MAG TPA: hypothetical protein DCM14_06390 [Clostridiales bacterium UBA8153]|nr:hypothetical protein [Clostridiales bacterium UBA8153]